MFSYHCSSFNSYRGLSKIEIIIVLQKLKRRHEMCQNLFKFSAWSSGRDKNQTQTLWLHCDVLILINKFTKSTCTRNLKNSNLLYAFLKYWWVSIDRSLVSFLLEHPDWNVAEARPFSFKVPGGCCLNIHSPLSQIRSCHYGEQCCNKTLPAISHKYTFPLNRTSSVKQAEEDTSENDLVKLVSYSWLAHVHVFWKKEKRAFALLGGFGWWRRAVI